MASSRTAPEGNVKDSWRFGATSTSGVLKLRVDSVWKRRQPFTWIRLTFSSPSVVTTVAVVRTGSRMDSVPMDTRP
ncbi:MAG: hypothetical protein QM757_07115 [Paludibaculum sp.]